MAIPNVVPTFLFLLAIGAFCHARLQAGRYGGPLLRTRLDYSLLGFVGLTVLGILHSTAPMRALLMSFAFIAVFSFPMSLIPIRAMERAIDRSSRLYRPDAGRHILVIGLPLGVFVLMMGIASTLYDPQVVADQLHKAAAEYSDIGLAVWVAMMMAGVLTRAHIARLEHAIGGPITIARGGP